MRILSVDTDPAHGALLGRHCRAILAHRLNAYDVAASCAAAAARLAEAAYDLVMLDPAGRRGDGFALIAKAHVPPARVIVVSARTELAMRAFDYGVVDFVPKPAQRARLARSLGRFEARHQPTLPGGPFLSVRRTGRIDLVPLDRIAWVRGADKYSELTLVCGRKEFCDRSLCELGLRLPAEFLRVHRSYMVRVALIARLIVQRGSRYSAEFHAGQRVPVGRSYYARLKARCSA